MKHFSPLGKNLKTVAYSSTGPSDGILCLARNSIETLNIDIIYPGRMVKITCKKRGSEKIFNFFSLYFPANDTALARLLVRKLRSSTASALMENPNSTIILLGDLNLPNLSDPESHDPRSPEAQFMDLVKNLGLNDLARECGDFEATWRGRGERVLTSSILDYAFAPPTLGITSTLHHHVARSDHDVLIFSNSTQNRKNTFSKPSERLFENKKFTDLAKNKLLDASRNFFLTPPDIAEDQLYIVWLDHISSALVNLNLEFQISLWGKAKNKEVQFRKQYKNKLKKIQAHDSAENRSELQSLIDAHIKELTESLNWTRLKWRIKAATDEGKSSRFNFVKYQARSSRKIASLADPLNPDKLLTDEKSIADAFATFHQKKNKFT